MGGLRGGRRKDDLEISGDLDRPSAVTGVPDRDAPQLDVVLGGDADLRVDVQAEVVVPELHASLREDRLLPLRCLHDGLRRSRPVFTGRGVAQVQESAPAVARGVLAPARERDVAPAAVAAAILAHHKVIAAIR